MDLRALRYADAREAGFQAARSDQRAHVCMRADGLRLRPYRQCAAGDRVRRAVPAAAAHLRREHVTLRPQHHRRRRQDQRARAEESGLPSTTRSARTATTDRQLSRRRRRARLPAADRRAARHRAYRRDAYADRPAGRVRQRLCRRRQCAVFGAVRFRLRPAVQAPARRNDRRRARRGRALQKDPRDFVRGSRRSRANRPGRHPPVSRRRAGPAGTSNARRCRGNISARCSTFTAAASISSFRTTRTKSPNRAAPSTRRSMANDWMHNGFLQVEGEKMLSPKATSLERFSRVAKGWNGYRWPGAVPEVCDAFDPLSAADQLDAEKPGRSRRTLSTFSKGVLMTAMRSRQVKCSTH